MTTDNLTANLARLESQVQWWLDQAQQVDRDRAMLRYVLPVGLACGAVAFYIKPLIGCGVFGTALVVWAMGLYMTTVRRSEFREQLHEAQTDLAQAQQQVRETRAAAPTPTT